MEVTALEKTTLWDRSACTEEGGGILPSASMLQAPKSSNNAASILDSSCIFYLFYFFYFNFLLISNAEKYYSAAISHLFLASSLDRIKREDSVSSWNKTAMPQGVSSIIY